MNYLLGLLLVGSLLASRPAPSSASDPHDTRPCKTVDGKDRPYPCEFQIFAINILGKKKEVVATLKPGNATVSLPGSQAVIVAQNSGLKSFVYQASLVFRRINVPSFSPKPVPVNFPTLSFYTISTAKVDYPLDTKELTLVNRVNVNPAVPPPTIRSNQVAFTLQLDYAPNGGGVQNPVKYVQIANPITFAKFPASVVHCRDRAEAFMAFYVSVDPNK
ncbi:hypothetical protein FAES_3855 [Fibrella aestuarina BUZ 2]|uniref:Uncharacterized protein n=1 Tax=Fibrella aestuarina BUZ 2 TaxID=1166018 RepID=I0KCK8_9BACT|nr:hypothetical protein [Fibrella aestuarina]CCH01861.1 hypothetical protein FAES_3855 [Fibrella aestuarina BUZ 2]